MSMDDDYRSLLNKMAVKRAVEHFLLGFIALCVVGIGIMLFFQNRSLSIEIKNQQQQAVAANNRFAARNQAELQQTEEIKSFIQCIALFFAQPNRADLTLNNLQACQFTTQPSSSASNQYATVPKQPQTDNPNAQQPTTSEPPASSTAGKHPSSSTASTPQPASSSQPTESMSFLQRAVGALGGLVKALALA